MPDEEAELEALNNTKENKRLNRLKSIDITIDSLKQYIALSTVSIVALFAFYNGNGKNGNQIWFLISITAFMLCAIFSVWNMNIFINKLHFNKINVRENYVRRNNWIPIFFFLAGIISSGIFLFGTLLNGEKYKADDSRILLKFEKSSIEIGKGVKAKIKIENDTMYQESIVTIDKEE